MDRPQVDIRSLSHDYCEFVLRNVDPSFANALRRIIIAEVPTVAIDLVEMELNSTVLNDEFIAHRLGLIPMVSDVAKFMKAPFEIQDDSDFYQVEFELDVKCTDDLSTLDVTTQDLRNVSEHPDGRSVMPVHLNQDAFRKPIVLVKMRKNQQLRFRAIARRGIGKDHAKWMPVATAVFQYMPVININDALMDELSEKEKMEFANSDPKGTFAYNPITGKVDVVALEAHAFDGEALNKAAELGVPGLLEVVAKQDEFIFRVEGTGALPVAEVVTTALDILEGRLNTLRAAVKATEYR